MDIEMFSADVFKVADTSSVANLVSVPSNRTQ